MSLLDKVRWGRTAGAGPSATRRPIRVVHVVRSLVTGGQEVIMCRLVEGRIRYRIEWPGVSADEKVEGWILPCVAEPLGDVMLDVPYASSLVR